MISENEQGNKKVVVRSHKRRHTHKNRSSKIVTNIIKDKNILTLKNIIKELETNNEIYNKFNNENQKNINNIIGVDDKFERRVSNKTLLVNRLDTRDSLVENNKIYKTQRKKSKFITSKTINKIKTSENDKNNEVLMKNLE